MEETPKPKSKKRKKSSPAIGAIIAIVFVVAIIALFVALLSGKTTTTTGGKADEKSESITCISTTANHPKFTVTGETSRELKFNLIFHSDKIDTIGLAYTIYYASAADVSTADTRLHIELDKGLVASGYDISAFNNKFNQYDNRLIINLSAKSEEIDSRAAPYFMLETDDDNVLSLQTKDGFLSNYRQQGFSCTENQ